jgi:glutathione peroxidase
LARHEAAGHAEDEGPKIVLNEVELKTIDGKYRSLYYYMDMALLIVNVASQCGLTPQYAGLQRLQTRFGEKGFSVLGFPCNQFGLQEPGSNDEIVEFCSTEYGVTFPLFDKIDVKGPDQHPLYAQLTTLPDDDGEGGDVEWNFEKFLVSPDLEVVRRWRPQREPESNTVVAAIRSVLP